MEKLHPSDGARKFVLIVEDSYLQAVALRGILETERLDLAIAKNGAEALDLLGLRLPSLIISDVVMPVMDGYALCRKVKTTPEFRAVPFMLLTQLSHPVDMFKGLEAGADYYNLKPFDAGKLRERVVAIINSGPSGKPGPDSNLAGLKLAYDGHAYAINAGGAQILDLLLATFENIVKKNEELQDANRKLSEALRDNKALRGLIPICSYCKKVRDDQGYWDQVESYVSKHSEAHFSHGICPNCYQKYIQTLRKTPGPAKETGPGTRPGV